MIQAVTSLERGVLWLTVTLAACGSVPEQGADECSSPPVPRAVAALDSAFAHPRTPLVLDSTLWQSTRHQAHPPPVVTSLRAAVEEYGAGTVAKSLLGIVHHGSPYFINAADRGRAAIAYGSLHRLHPDAAPVGPLPALLLREDYPDEVREGLAIASRYFRDESPELTRALAAVQCQAAAHLRPFVHGPSDLAVPYDRHWYGAALGLLRESVRALAVRPDGEAALADRLDAETNSFLADQMRDWAARADTFPYWTQELYEGSPP